MVEKYSCEVECCNPKCPQRFFPLSRKVASSGAVEEMEVEVSCPYCGVSNMVLLPGVAPETTTTLRGARPRRQ